MPEVCESDLEEPFAVILKTRLVEEFLPPAAEPIWLVQKTARGGPSAGQWTQPDIVLASRRKYRSRAVPELELFGFELKLARGLDISAVHQALAHTRFLHYSHVVVHCPSDEVWKHRLTDVRSHAQTHGIGLIRLRGADAQADYEIALPSKRFDPLPLLVDQFLDRFPILLDWVDDRLRP